MNLVRADGRHPSCLSKHSRSAKVRTCPNARFFVRSCFLRRQLSPDKERLIVSDPMAMQMVVFKRALDTGELTVRQRLAVSGSPDNLKIDLYRGTV